MSSDRRGLINPYNKNNVEFGKNDVQNILKKYGIFQNINNLSLYQEAMVHESYSVPHIKNVIARDNVSLVGNQMVYCLYNRNLTKL